MKDGFVKVCALSPRITVADVEANEGEILSSVKQACEKGAKLIVCPELCLTGYTCGDLFLQETLLSAAAASLERLCEATKELEALLFIGLPVEKDGALYNAAAVLYGGELLALIPKTYLPNYNEFYELRHFTPAGEKTETIFFAGREVPFGTGILFSCRELPELVVGAELCEDLWAPVPPSTGLALAGATVIVNLSASNELTGKEKYRRDLVASQSARLLAGYVYAASGEGESTGDLVFGAHNLIAENGVILSESRLFSNEAAVSEIDVKRLSAERRRMNTFERSEREVLRIPFSLKLSETVLTRRVNPAPFVPAESEKESRWEQILMIQAMGLKKRLMHTNSKCAVVGVSGGLDSTLALLVTAKAFDLAGLERTGILGITMPGFGTTDRTHQNAKKLIERLGARFREIGIADAVRLHFTDIGHDEAVHDVTYENSQARERTQILMDLANQENALLVGTGDLSELALGWATYNGDHMSMYGVNAGVPKTLVRYLVAHFGATCEDTALAECIRDICDTPVSPELLPPEGGKIAQKTEELVGPYELHDFFLYHFLRYGCRPGKLFRLAKCAFDGKFSEEELLKWERTFLRRFFSQQFKRSCLPDGPKVGSIALSPRGDLRMPSDASAQTFLRELDEIHIDK